MYDEIYIPPYTGDMGTAIGCALYAHRDVFKKLPAKSNLNTGFLGYDIDIKISSLKDIIIELGDVPLDKELYI